MQSGRRSADFIPITSGHIREIRGRDSPSIEQKSARRLPRFFTEFIPRHVGAEGL